MTDMINHPPHYTGHPSGVECIQITRHMGFNLGNAFKYIWRADMKGAALEDLRKAAWYIADEIAKREAASTLPRENLPFEAVKAERDAALAASGWRACTCRDEALRCTCPALDTEPQPLEWPQTPEIAPPEGVRRCTCSPQHPEACDCHLSALAESAPAARVCVGCKSYCDFTSTCLSHRSERLYVEASDTCSQWQPKPGALANIAARDQTAYSAQKPGVTE